MEPLYITLARTTSKLLQLKAYYTHEGKLYCFDCGVGPTLIENSLEWIEPGTSAHEASIIIDEVEDWLKKRKK